MIDVAEQAILGVIQDEMECYAEFGTIDVSTGPGEWNGAYLKSLLPKLPAIRLVFGGGKAQNSTALTLDSSWTLYAVTGWQGQDEERRRRAESGAYAMLSILAPRLHNILLHKDDEDIAMCRVDEITNEWTAELERLGVAVYGLSLDVPLAIDYDPPARAQKVLSDYLRSGVQFDLPGGSEPDSSEVLDMRPTPHNP